MTELAPAREEATYKITVAFRDSQDAPVAPKSATWTLTDANKNVVNGRQTVVIAPLAASVSILLTGADLAINTERRRIFTVRYVYDSTEGSDLEDWGEATFVITHALNVP